MVYVIGYPSSLGGADTELWHTLRLWRSAGLEVSLIPTWGTPDKLWSDKATELGCQTLVWSPDELKSFDFAGSPCVSFCNSGFLEMAPYLESAKLIWVNCMTFMFRLETEFLEKGGQFHTCVFQSEYQRSTLGPLLKKAGQSVASFVTIPGAFDTSILKYAPRIRTTESFTVGRLARPDADKWSSNTWRIYRAIPYANKSAIVMGVDKTVLDKLGEPPSFVSVLRPNAISAESFFSLLHCLLPINGGARENWPRAGLEAMASGVPIVAQAAWGWNDMIIHNETGFLCRNDEELAYYAASLAYDELLRQQIIRNAYAHLTNKLAHGPSLLDKWRTVLGE